MEKGRIIVSYGGDMSEIYCIFRACVRVGFTSNSVQIQSREIIITLPARTPYTRQITASWVWCLLFDGGLKRDCYSLCNVIIYRERTRHKLYCSVIWPIFGQQTHGLLLPSSSQSKLEWSLAPQVLQIGICAMLEQYLYYVEVALVQSQMKRRYAPVALCVNVRTLLQ